MPRSREQGRGVGWAALLVITSIPLVACGAGGDGNSDQTFEVGDTPRLVLGAGDGSVFVRTGLPGTITVLSDVTSKDNVDLEIVADGDIVTVRSSTTRSGNLIGGSAQGAVDFTITVPPQTAIEIGIANGPITVQDIQGGGTITSAAGDISLTGVSGDCSGGTGVGDITISGASGSFQFTAGIGLIVFDGRLDPGSSNEFETGIGDVTVWIPGDTGVDLDATVTTGSLSNELTLTQETSESSFLGERLSGILGDGGGDLSVKIGVGALEIRGNSGAN